MSKQLREAYDFTVGFLKMETAKERALRLTQPTHLGGVVKQYTPDQRIAWIKKLMKDNPDSPSIKYRTKEFHRETIKELKKLNK